MRHAGNFHVSRFVQTYDGDADRPFTVYFSRLSPVGARFVAGRVGLLPHPRMTEVDRRFRKASRTAAENHADTANDADVAARIAG